jgi:hypothetical protein
MNFAPSEIERLVMRRAARENLYAPEYPEKFQTYMMNLWARDCYAPKESGDDLSDLIREGDHTEKATTMDCLEGSTSALSRTFF